MGLRRKARSGKHREEKKKKDDEEEDEDEDKDAQRVEGKLCEGSVVVLAVESKRRDGGGADGNGDERTRTRRWEGRRGEGWFR